ncbi:MAG: hypothetical protein U9N62_13740 [Thermotogota bacterium]|nr:hypothetical protein [Thermotogota bacterium]
MSKISFDKEAIWFSSIVGLFKANPTIHPSITKKQPKQKRRVSDLQDAIDKRYENILVTRELADKVRTAYALKTAGKVAISVLSATLVGATMVSPFTGGLSYLALVPVSVATGVSIPFLVAVSFVGFSLIMAICNHYDLIEVGYGKLKLRLRRK